MSEEEKQWFVHQESSCVFFGTWGQCDHCCEPASASLIADFVLDDYDISDTDLEILVEQLKVQRNAY